MAVAFYMLTGQAVIAAAGTQVQLGKGTMQNGVTVYAKSTNTGIITIGGTGVNNVVNGTGNGHMIPPGGAVSIPEGELNDVFINGTASGDIVSYLGN